MTALNEITLDHQGSDPTVSNTATASFLIAFSDGNKAAYTASVDGTPIGTFGWVNGQYTPGSDALGITRIVTPALLDGAHLLVVTETSPHAQPLAPFNFTVDTLAPPKPNTPQLASYSNPSHDGTTTPYPNPAITGTAQPNAPMTLVVDGASGQGGALTNNAGAYTARTTPLTNGQHAIRVIQQDPAGNESPQSDTLAINVVLPPPTPDTVPPIVHPISKTSTTTTMTQLRWSGTDPANTDGTPGSGIDFYRIYRNGTLLDTARFPAYGDITGQPGDTYAVEAVDRAGNVGARVTIS